MMPARELTFRGPNGHFGLHVPSAEVTRMLDICRGAFPSETGGILIGVYNESLNCAAVRNATGPGRDSRAGRTWFERGVIGLQELLRSHWQQRSGYYLGEWHFHPGAPPIPSPRDERSMREFASSPLYRCAEPLLLIIGGDPQHMWTVSAAVYPRLAKTVSLELVDRAPGVMSVR